jgi:hypothetical protein
MENKTFNELEKAILNSDFIKNNPKLVSAPDKKKAILGMNKIKRKMVGGFFSSYSLKSKENFYENLKEIGIIKNEKEYRGIVSEIDEEKHGILFSRGSWNNPMNISKHEKGYCFKCYNPEEELHLKNIC